MSRFEINAETIKNKLANTEVPIINNNGKGEQQSDVTDLPAYQLHDFLDHPYKVIEDDAMDELVRSIQDQGIIEPLLVRPDKDGYEVISGHRRKKAAELCGIKILPCKVMEISHDEAVDLMVDSNIYRPNILPSEKAFAYRMKMEAKSHQGKAGGRTDDELAAETGDSARTIQRYIRLTYLFAPFLELVDEGKIGVSIGADISFLSEKSQTQLFQVYETEKCKIKSDDIAILRDIEKADGPLSEEDITGILCSKDDTKPEKFKVDEKEISEYVPESFSVSEKKEFVLTAVKYYYQNIYSR